MNLTLSPQQGLPGQPEMALFVAGETLTIDGVDYDLSAVPEGGEGVPDEGPFVGCITRQSGVLHVTISARMGDDAAPDQGGPWVIEGPSGDVPIPYTRVEAVE